LVAVVVKGVEGKELLVSWSCLLKTLVVVGVVDGGW